MRLIRLLAVLAATAVLVACSDGGSGPEPGTGGGDGGGVSTDGGGGGEQSSSLPDPCSLVTKAEVEAAAGGPVADGVEHPIGPNHYAFGQGRLCTFVPDNGVVGLTTISVFSHSPDGWEQYKANQAAFSSFHEVAGVGEEAVGIGGNQIGLHQGGYVLDIAVGLYIAGDPAGGPRVLDLARAAAGRLAS